MVVTIAHAQLQTNCQCAAALEPLDRQSFIPRLALALLTLSTGTQERCSCGRNRSIEGWFGVFFKDRHPTFNTIKSIYEYQCFRGCSFQGNMPKKK